MGWNFDNTYLKLPKKFYSKINLNPVKAPELILLNERLVNCLGLDINELKSTLGVEILSGSKSIEKGAFIAQAYAGHQFGHFTLLGDGRALLIGEQVTPKGKRYDIQLKGSGITPYSRGGDGRAALGPMLREYIISMAMEGLGIPTTKGLAVLKTGEKIYREDLKEGAILVRVASSHIRFGTFEYAARFGSINDVKLLADYSLERHYPEIEDDENKYINLLRAVIKSQAILIAKWQSIGFIHGVMNTDNMTISGETIDYGPCAFMDVYNENTVFSSIDANGRYAYKNQPNIIRWNLCRFAETLLPLLSDDKYHGVKIANDAIEEFSDIYYSSWMKQMRGKLGLISQELQDKALIEDLLLLMGKYKEDYTNTFVKLTFNKDFNNEMFSSKEFKDWYSSWQKRLERQEISKEKVHILMKESNPAVIPRNHRVEEALRAAENGSLDMVKKLIHVILNPYEHSIEQNEYSKVPLSNKCYRTYCGT